MSIQRDRGEVARIYLTAKVTDSRNNVIETPLDDFIEVRGAFAPDRSARAEVVGQQQVNVFRMLTASDLSGVSLWSLVKWRNLWWDIVAPPGWHIGDRHTRHWSILIRQRPDSGGNLA